MTKVTRDNLGELDFSEISEFCGLKGLTIESIALKLESLSSQLSNKGKGLLFEELMCKIYFLIQEQTELPNCVKIKSTVYLVCETQYEADDIGKVFELMDITTEMKTGDSYSIYVSNWEVFEQATEEERIEVRDFFNSI
jgi:hypothetical protein